MSHLISFFAALQFLTIMPPIIRRRFTHRELGGAVAWYPAAGLVLGALLSAGNELLLRFLPGGPSAVLTLTAWLLLTRGLHFDGFLDACDGLFGGFTPERRLEIMRDTRVGAFAVAGGVLLLMLKYSTLQTLSSPSAALIMAPILGRWTISFLVPSFPYGRKQGLGRTVKDNAGAKDLVVAAIFTVVCAGLVSGAWGLVAFLFTTTAGLLLAIYLLRLLPGLTGDIYGATCELVEALVLLYFVTIGG